VERDVPVVVGRAEVDDASVTAAGLFEESNFGDV